MSRWRNGVNNLKVNNKENFNDEDAFEEDEEDSVDGYDEENDWMPTLMDEDEDK